MNRKWVLAAILLSASALLFWLQVSWLKRPADTLYYLLQDLAFLPINVILVTLGVDTLVRWRERQSKLDKLNLLLSEYFTESGNELILILNPFVENIGEVQQKVRQIKSSAPKRFQALVKEFEGLDIKVNALSGQLEPLAAMMEAHKGNLLALFQNPNLLEHDRFTDMLWAVYHLTDELKSRMDLKGLPDGDLEHIAVDMRHAYTLLVIEWIIINRHMAERYPYLFKAANRRSPFPVIPDKH